MLTLTQFNNLAIISAVSLLILIHKKVCPKEPPLLGNSSKTTLSAVLVGNLGRECNKNAPEIKSYTKEPLAWALLFEAELDEPSLTVLSSFQKK